MLGKAYIFINYSQAIKLGHIGWGFALGNDRYYFGSTDHIWRIQWWDLPSMLAYMSVPASSNNDWWAAAGAREDMFAVMRDCGHHVRYHAYKTVEVPEADPIKAWRAAETIKCIGWDVLSNNCLHQSHKIFCNYGAERHLPSLRDPLSNSIPNNWFRAIASMTRSL